MSLTLDIAQKALSLEWDHLPPVVQHTARLCLADGLAVMLGAVRHEPAVQPFAAQARSYGPGPATLLAGGSAPAPAAALANGALSHALDFEDTFDAAGLHVNAAIIPVVLALAEAKKKSLGDVLIAMTLGADFACRIGLSLTTDPASRGWYHPPMIGSFGAALAGARLLGLSPEKTVAALSLTLVQLALTDALKRAPASDLRAVRDGFAARAACEAVLLAKGGVTGTPDPLAENGGLVPLLTGAPPAPEPFNDFGENFHTPDLSLKTWPCCRGTHPAIALALELRDAGTAPEELAGIAFTLNPPDDMLFEPRTDRIRPGTAIAAKFSIPYCFAHTMLHGPPGLDAFNDDARRDTATLALASTVTLESCTAGAEKTALLTFKDGSRSDHVLPEPPTLLAATSSFDEITDKLRDCLGPSDAIDTLLSLETADPSQPIPHLMTSLANRDGK